MKEFRVTEGRFSLRLHYELKEIDQICIDALREAKALPTDPKAIEIDRFLESYWRVPLLYEDLGQDIMGSTVFNSMGAVTGFTVARWLDEEGTSRSERRLRSTLAHEGGHGLLHPRLFIAESTPSLFGTDLGHNRPRNFMCRSSDVQPATGIPKYNGQWWEWQANRAIGSLLLPIPLVRKVVHPFTEPTQFGDILKESHRSKVVEELAEIFQVNPIVARIRLEETYPQDNHSKL